MKKVPDTQNGMSEEIKGNAADEKADMKFTPHPKYWIASAQAPNPEEEDVKLNPADMTEPAPQEKPKTRKKAAAKPEAKKEAEAAEDKPKTRKKAAAKPKAEKEAEANGDKPKTRKKAAAKPKPVKDTEAKEDKPKPRKRAAAKKAPVVAEDQLEPSAPEIANEAIVPDVAELVVEDVIPDMPEADGIMPMVNAEPIKVLFAASEAVPFVKTGGLADVAGTLPIALKRAGIDARVILPKYNDISEHWKSRMRYLTHFYVQMGWRRQYCGIMYVEFEGVTFYFVDNEFYFARDSVYGDGQEEGERFGFFCRAVLDALSHIDFLPDILHCNDWQTGMIPVLLRAQYMGFDNYSRIRTIFTIHNLKFQGVFAWKYIDDMFNLGPRYYAPDMLEFYGDISFLKAGLVFSDRISTVSPTYATEIQSPYYGERLDGLLRARQGQLSGILNGIDYVVWDPATDYLMEHHYSVDDMRGKALSKARLQREVGLPERDDVMLVGIVSRLTEQKGFSLIERVLTDMMNLPIQFVVVGQGDSHYMEMLTWAQWRYHEKVAARFELNEWLAHCVYAGADLFLMPSRFEPCGISQLISLRYGTVPLVRETGGLSDTVEPYNKYTDQGTGFSFANYNAHEMLYTLEQACNYFQDKKLWARLIERGMRMKFDWEGSALKYKELYEQMLGD